MLGIIYDTVCEHEDNEVDKVDIILDGTSIIEGLLRDVPRHGLGALTDGKGLFAWSINEKDIEGRRRVMTAEAGFCDGPGSMEDSVDETRDRAMFIEAGMDTSRIDVGEA